MQKQGLDLPTEAGFHSQDGAESVGVLRGQTSDKKGQALATRKGFNTFANSMHKNTLGSAGGQMSSLARTPQELYMLSGPQIPNRGRDFKGGIPKTSQD